jgi:nucleotide-binding universal stress UspA family protein
MTTRENFTATTEARAAAGRSAAAISRQDAAMQRYLRAQQTVSLTRPPEDEPSYPPAGRVPLLSEIHSVPPTLSPARPQTAAKAAQRTDLVVVGVDGSAHSRRAANWAAAEAASRHAPLRLVYAYQLPVAGYAAYSMAPSDLGRVMRAEGRRMLTDVAEDLRELHPGLDVHTRLFQGDAVVALRRASETARLTVVGSRGQGRVAGTLLGSVALAITAHGSAPVAVIPVDGPGWTIAGPVVVGVDGSPTSEAAIDFAFEEAAIRGAPLVTVHAWSDPRPTLSDVSPTDVARLEESERATLTEQLARWRDKYPDVEVISVVAHGKPTPALLEQAQQAQLLVVGSRGRGGFTGMLLGSTSHSLITHALCPVVVVRPT